jgi:hypothetical protein
MQQPNEASEKPPAVELVVTVGRDGRLLNP